MGFKDLDIKLSYISYGEDNIASSLIIPALKYTKLYRRSVGFFSSSVLQIIGSGINYLVKNNGKIQLIISPRLSLSDTEAIEAGYRERENIIGNSFSKEFQEELDKMDNHYLKMLAELIAKEYIDIKLAVSRNENCNKIGIYHDKLGILEDLDGNYIVFYGSANSTKNGYQDNYEKVRVVKSWVEGQLESVNDELDEFESLWNGTNPFVNIYNYSEAAKHDVVEVIERRKQYKRSLDPIQLRDYQLEAISSWEKNDFKGFYVMATGTGKTWTAIFSAKKLLEKTQASIIICAPYKHLIKQWYEDIIKAFPTAKTILVSSENAMWESEIRQEIIRRKNGVKLQLILISTIASFASERFINIVNDISGEKLLIVDEAHRFKVRSENIAKSYKYMLGLSATPYSGKSAESGKQLMNFFGGQVFNLPIEVALEKKYLVDYLYYPIFVHATEEEEQTFRNISTKIFSCFENGQCIDAEKLGKYLRARLRVISMSEEKLKILPNILMEISFKDHIVVYCGDGTLFDTNINEEKRHINAVMKVLNENGYRASQFTAQEKMNERMELVNSFNKGSITALAAIRCLDEGINIPSIKCAIILSSNDDYREFVQRRGRILRKFKGKDYAKIFDVIVLPQHDNTTWASIEFRRFYEYAKLALNKEQLLSDLQDQCSYYNLDINSINIYNYEEELEGILDE